MSSGSEIVITGLGVVSPIGNGIAEFWQSLLDERSGVRVREEFADTDWPHRIAAPVTEFDGRQYVKPRKAIKVMCRPIQFAYAAAVMAAEQAGLFESDANRDRIGAVFGTETFFADPLETVAVFRKCVTNHTYHHDRWGEFAMREIQPLWMLKYLPNMAASHISIALDARGPNNSICQGEVSGLLAVIEGSDLIQRGVADIVVAGGTGCQMSLNSMLYRGSQRMSNRVREPELASRPFDADRDGMVVGEGAAAVILESADSARRRGANVLSKLIGWSRSFATPCRPDFSEGLISNLKSTLSRARVDRGRVGHVNAHGVSTIKDDIDESIAIREMFGETPVVAHKSNFGNLGPATSVVELVGCVLAIQNSRLPGSLNYKTPDPRCPINVLSHATDCPSSAAIKMSFSSTGQIASVAIAPP